MADTTELVVDPITARVLERLSSSAGPWDVSELAGELGLDQSRVHTAIMLAESHGQVSVSEQQVDELAPTPEARGLIEQGLPERIALRVLLDAGGSADMPTLAEACKQRGIAVNEVLKWGPVREWLERDPKTKAVKLTDKGRAAASSNGRELDETLLLASSGGIALTGHADEARLRTLLGKRPELAKLKKRTRRQIAKSPTFNFKWKVLDERNLLTHDDLRSGEWRGFSLRAYDVSLEAEKVHPAKAHPLRKIIEQTRTAYLEMGFTEVVSPMIESSFWNFDALFQPQDHPARDMQDTFYMDEPATTALPADSALVDRVRRAHEDGGDTGSEGWGYKWSPERAKQIVLRTHTTASTIRALARHPEPPFKAFCVGWVCRNETMSYKHLPVFHQVDGIVIDENASLASLLGTLETFYRKMGFKQVKFKPAFYPYTEPSVDVVVYLESRGKWIEMGGSGIFRPEVTEPLGCKHPVLAWGLGMERLAMIRYGLSDIRELYQGRLEALRGMALWQ